MKKSADKNDERRWCSGERSVLVCGDSREALKSIESNSVDLIATDPPY